LTQKVLIIGDTHVGSDAALAPEEIILESNNRILANDTQLAILQEFYNMIDDVGTVDLLILNGDLIEGINYQNEGMGCLPTNIDVQVDNAIDILSEIKFRKAVGCKGTRYHCKSNPCGDKMVIEGLGGIFMDEVSMNIYDTRIYANHRTSTRMQQWENRSASVAKDLLFAELNAMDFGKYDIIAKSHVHYYLAIDYGGSIGFVCPGWKGRDEYAKSSINPFAFNPSIGYIMFEIDKGGDFTWSKVAKHLKGNNAIKTYDIDEIPHRS
jgi:hypothetical protein